MSIHSFTDCETGTRVVSPGVTITEAHVVNFASLTGDWNPVHFDAEVMRNHPLGERIAHGMLILSLAFGQLSRLQGHQLLPLEGVVLAGLEKVRFVDAVRLGDTIQMHGEVVDKSRLNETSGTITVRIKMLNQREELVLTARAQFILPSHPESGPAPQS